MKFIVNFFALSLFLVFSFSLYSCKHSSQVVPYDVDVEEIFKPLEPNESDNPNDSTYGAEKIPGCILELDLKTDNDEVYILFEKLTLLDINSKIIQNLFEFVQQELCEYGFVNQSFSLPSDAVLNLIAEGNNYREAALKVINMEKEAFDAQLDTIASFNSPFNIRFNIYPVYLDSKFVTYRLNAYSYTGGAHGITISHLRTFDLMSGNELKLEDIVKSSDIKEVRQDVIAQMAYSYPIYENITTVPQYLDSLNVFMGGFHGEGDAPDAQLITEDNYPLPDPAITENGLVFIYQMYELTPASDGCPVILIPYSDIKGCLKDNIGK